MELQWFNSSSVSWGLTKAVARWLDVNQVGRERPIV